MPYRVEILPSDHYIDQLRRVVRHVRAAKERVVVEPVVRIGHDEATRQALLEKSVLKRDVLIRSDCMYVAPQGPPQPVAAQQDSTRRLASFIAEIGSTEVTVYAFRWEHLVVIFDDGDVPADWTPLLAWFDAWFDRACTKAADADGLHGVVHAPMEPERGEGGRSGVVIDLGSAPAQAFADLVTAVGRLGVPRATIWSPDPPPPERK